MEGKAYEVKDGVLPAHRGRGLGGRMLDMAIDWFDEMNAEYAEAHTHPSNTPLQNLFASRGFEKGPVQELSLIHISEPTRPY